MGPRLLHCVLCFTPTGNTHDLQSLRWVWILLNGEGLREESSPNKCLKADDLNVLCLSTRLF